MIHRPAYLTTHMIASVRKQLRAYKSKEVAGRVGIALELYAKATKFLLPFNGVLFDDTNMVKYVEFLRLPFTSVVLEYEGTSGAFFERALPTDQVTQISILATEAAGVDQDGIGVFCAYKNLGIDWVLLPATLFIPRGITAEDFTNRGVGAYRFDEELLGEVAGGTSMTPNQVATMAAEAILKESLSVFQFCAACECSNVKYDEIKAPKFVNAKRVAKGEVPLFEYKVLAVDVQHHPEHKAPQGGTHASPREHLRRGHIRRYQDGHTVWINAMIVGRPELGRIVKDYRIKIPTQLPKGT